MRQMKLGLFFAPGGHHLAAWRHPNAYPHGFDIKSYVTFAQTAERACFDMVFVADVYSLTPDGRHRDTLRFEPITLLSALAMVTSRIGLAATATTTYNEPYNVARQFASLDQISHGRAGWNIVTSSSNLEAYNFGYDAHPASENRYKIAHEFVDVVRGLWDSWDEGALPIDKASAHVLRPDKLHVLNHVGQNFKVRGPLTIPRSPQGQPVLVQAGSSDDGKTLAASVAEVIFTIQRDLAGAQAFYKDIKARADRARPQSATRAGHAGRHAHHRAHAAGGAGPVRAASGSHPSGSRSQRAVADARRGYVGREHRRASSRRSTPASCRAAPPGSSRPRASTR